MDFELGLSFKLLVLYLCIPSVFVLLSDSPIQVLSKLRGAGWDGEYKQNGSAMFGLTSSRVRDAIEALVGAERCSAYVFHGDSGSALLRQEGRAAPGWARRRSGLSARYSPKTENTKHISAGQGRGKGMKGVKKIQNRMKVQNHALTCFHLLSFK